MNRIILLLAFFVTSFSLSAQTAMVGMTFEGGSSNLGTLFSIGAGDTTLLQQHQLTIATPGANPVYAQCIEATNGKLYGMTRNGGANNYGVIFEYDYITNNYSAKIDFNGSDGQWPFGSLMLADNGKLYGMTGYGGAYGEGVLFEYDFATNTYTKKVDFSITNGSNPHGSLMQASNGKFYGMTRNGGANGWGVIFEYDYTLNVYTKKVDFNGSNGGYPNGSLIQATNGKLFGMTRSGGANNLGVIFEYDIATNVNTKIIDLGISNGSNPHGSLMQATNGKFYGMTSAGGTNNQGVLFEYDFPTNTYIKKVEFNGSNGRNPYGSLLQATNGKLYGMTETGGVNNLGVTFEYDFANNMYTNSMDFDGNNGANPFGSLMQAANGKLYGMTQNAGASSYGVIFEFDYITNICINKVNFNNTDGRNPQGSLMQATNGKLYGVTYLGGTNNHGVLFEYDYPTNTYARKVDFNSSFGSYPIAALIQATNGKIYGMTRFGGANDKGVIFEYDYTTNTYTKKVDFDGNNGANPFGSLMEAANGKLYGMTESGGASFNGVIFEYDYMTDTYTKKVDFNGSNGKFPQASLMQATNGNIYGMTRFGGTNDKGVIFEYVYTTNTYTKNFDFDGNNGANPYGSLIQATNGKIYGMTMYGGANNQGVIFEHDYMTTFNTKILDFNGTNGANPGGSLKQSINGKLYGMTWTGGTSNLGVIFEYDYTNNTYIKKLDFKGPNGKFPRHGHLIEINIPVGLNIEGDALESTIYPNPAKNRVNILFKALRNGHAEIAVIDLMGRRMIQTGMTATAGDNHMELYLNNCNSGLYLLQVTDASGNSTVTRLAVE